MELYSVAFFLFVAFFLCIHELAGKYKTEYQWVVRLVASLLFYTWIAKWRIIALIVSVVSVYLGARRMNAISAEGRAARKGGDLSKEEKKLLKAAELRRKRGILAGTLAVNLGILIAVKYIAPHIGQGAKGIALPLGISFYTFMAISYLLDVYGEKYVAEENIGKIALYLSWFPQMLQGPINRFDHVRESLFGRSRLEYEQFKSCALLFLFGAIKKYALANVLAPCVNEFFTRSDLSDLPGSLLLFVAFLFAIEQYADFSGGIDMVMAVSGLFGVKMDDNFKQPYFSRSLAQFWRRWHISLGSFMRDYVFYPFAMLPFMAKLNKKAGDRFGKRFGRSLVAGISNLLIFALVGLWHGSQLHYLIWGLYNGIIIAVSDFGEPLFDTIRKKLKINADSRPYALFQMLRTFMIIVLAGYFDAVEDVSNGLICFKNTFLSFRAGELKTWLAYMYDCNLISDIGMIVAAVSLLLVIAVSILRENHKDFISLVLGRNIVIRWAVYFVMIYIMLFGFASAGAGGGFMYAAF